MNFFTLNKWKTPYALHGFILLGTATTNAIYLGLEFGLIQNYEFYRLGSNPPFAISTILSLTCSGLIYGYLFTLFLASVFTVLSESACHFFCYKFNTNRYYAKTVFSFAAFFQFERFGYWQLSDPFLMHTIIGPNPSETVGPSIGAFIYFYYAVCITIVAMVVAHIYLLHRSLKQSIEGPPPNKFILRVITGFPILFFIGATCVYSLISGVKLF